MSDVDTSPMAATLRPFEAADQLGISTATLRRWSRRFDQYLVLSDESAGGGGHRRYTAENLTLLAQVKTLLDEGLTYDQVAERLQDSGAGPAAANLAEPLPVDEADMLADPEESTGSIWPGLNDLDATTNSEQDAPQRSLAEPISPAVQFLRDTLHAVAESQQVMLNSQQASRDMLGVMIQDNLNLKNENTGLRDRMLDMERELAELRRRQTDYRERMETRVRVLEDAVATLMASRQAPPSRPPQAQAPPREPERRGFWSRLMGG